MPDVTVTFGAQDDGLSAAIAKWRAEMGMGGLGGGAGAPPTTPPPFGLGGPPPVPGPLTQAAMAQVAAKKKLADQNKETAQSEEELGEATARTSSRFDRLLTRIAEATLVYGAIRLAIEAVKTTIEAATQKEFEVVKFQNVAAGITNVNRQLAETRVSPR
jgi:hypothetical protein